jgi:hypothetical protein
MRADITKRRGPKAFWRAALFIAGPVLALEAAQEKALWKLKVTSPDGYRFFETAEYVGPESLATNAQLNPPDKSTPSELPAQLMLHTGHGRTNGTQYSAGYYRGPYYSTESSRPGGSQDTLVVNQVSVFSSTDNMILVVAVDHGNVYSSTNSGINWEVFGAPGKYSFPISTGPDGSGFFAEVSIGARSFDSGAATGPIATKPPDMDWYVVGTGQKGGQLVVTASRSSGSPALNITHSNNHVIVSWGASFTDFTLQQNASLGTTNWVNVPFPVQETNAQNEVVIPSGEGQYFYRLRHR